LVRFERYSAFEASADEWPEYVRIIHGRSGSGRRGDGVIALRL
jgi:hypothetical protein